MKSAILHLGLACLVLVAVIEPAAGRSSTSRDDPLDAPAVPNFDTPAAQLRIAVNRALAEHAFLLGEAMRAQLGDREGLDAAGAALEENTVELIGLMGDTYGEAAGDQFGELWRNHVAYLVDYTRALEAGDEGAQDLAQRQLHEYVTDFSSFLAEANPNLPSAAVEQLIGEHVEQLEAIAAYDAGNYGEAYPAIRATYEQMFVIGDALSEAIALQFPDRFTGKSVAYSPAGDLRLSMDRLLGEHTVLAVTAMRAGVSDAADQAAASDALDANTDALAAVVADIYGEAAGDAFIDLWRDHTDAYLALVSSTLEGAAGRQEALDMLAEYQTAFSQFLADANPELSPAALRGMLKHHTDQLVEQVNAFASGDYDRAYTTARDAFAHAFVMGDALALAIAAQFPDMFPDTALRQHLGRPGLVGVGVALILASAIMLARRRVARTGSARCELGEVAHRRRE